MSFELATNIDSSSHDFGPISALSGILPQPTHQPVLCIRPFTTDVPRRFHKTFSLMPASRQYNIRTVADLPCGDVAWQFSVPSINKAKAYFGGDISASVAKRNGEQYTSHLNKMFRHWDLIECGVPQVCLGSSCTPFDMVITRDALQHMTVFDGLKAVKNIVSSGAKYFAVSSYPPETVDKMARAAYTGSGSGLQMRAGHPGQGFRQEVSEGYIQRCQSDDALKRKYCQQGAELQTKRAQGPCPLLLGLLSWRRKCGPRFLWADFNIYELWERQLVRNPAGLKGFYRD